MGELVLARHGETEWSRELRHTGRTDVPLTETGREEARALGRALSGRSFALVLASPLRRAVETARLALGREPATDDRLREWDYGEVEGLTTPQWQERHPGWLLWRDGCPGGETAADVGARADALLADVVPRLASGDVLLVAHGHLLRVLTARRLGLAPEEGARFVFGAGRLGVLGAEHEIPALTAWNLAPPD